MLSEQVLCWLLFNCLSYWVFFSIKWLFLLSFFFIKSTCLIFYLSRYKETFILSVKIGAKYDHIYRQCCIICHLCRYWTFHDVRVRLKGNLYILCSIAIYDRCFESINNRSLLIYYTVYHLDILVNLFPSWQFTSPSLDIKMQLLCQTGSRLLLWREHLLQIVRTRIQQNEWVFARVLSPSRWFYSQNLCMSYMKHVISSGLRINSGRFMPQPQYLCGMFHWILACNWFRLFCSVNTCIEDCELPTETSDSVPSGEMRNACSHLVHLPRFDFKTCLIQKVGLDVTVPPELLIPLRGNSRFSAASPNLRSILYCLGLGRLKIQ